MSPSDFTKSRAYLAAIVDSSDDAIISKDLDGIVRSFNGAAERLFGYRAGEVIGRSITLLLPPDRRDEEGRILAELRRGDRIDHFETVRVAKDGRRIDVSLSVSPVRDETGRVVGAAKIARDITERKRAAEALAAQREWFRVTLQSIGDAVIASDPAGRVTFMNRVAERLTGWKNDEALGRPLVDVFHIINETTRNRVDNPVEKVMRTGLVVGLANHTVLVGRDGSEWPIDDSAAPIYDDEQGILGVVLVFHDVTEQRRAERALAEQREWLETTLASIGDAVIATDMQGRVAFMNAVAERLTGWRIADARGRSCDDVFRIVNEQSREVVPSPVARVFEQGTVVGLANHTVLIAADGTERPIDDSGAPIRDYDDRIVGAVLVFRDVSESRRIDAERQSAAREREQLLESERAARAEAERASKVKDEFVAMVSHELRTPLGAILGWTQILQREATNERFKHGLEVVARNTRTQAQLISDLLDVSRITSGKLVLDVQPLELAAVVAESLETLEHAAGEKGIDIVQRVDGRFPTVGDPARLRQVVWNLLSNAIKFTPSGGRVELRLTGVDSYAQIVVADTGVGIAGEDIHKIFERFQQPGPNTTRRYGGLGLGLAIAKHLVELHGGRIRAASEGDGKGAIFTVELPLRPRSARTEAPPPTSEAVPHLDEDIRLSGVTVLVVEDEADMRTMITVILEEHGASVIATASAAEALEAVRRGPDIIVSDIGLPDVDGYELMRRIRSSAEAYARTPAVALTAFARPDDRSRAIRVGFQSHITKPFEAGELLATIASFRSPAGGSDSF